MNPYIIIHYITSFVVTLHYYIMFQTPDDLDSLYDRCCDALQAENAELTNFTPVLLKKGGIAIAAEIRAPSDSG